MRNWNLCLDSWRSEDLSSILWWYMVVVAIMLRPNTWLPSRMPKPQSMNNKTAPILPSWFKRNAQVFGLTVLLSDSCCDCQLWKLWKYVSNWTSYYLPYAIPAVDCWYTHDYCWYGFLIMLQMPPQAACIICCFGCRLTALVFLFWYFLFSWSDYMQMSLFYLSCTDFGAPIHAKKVYKNQTKF